MNLPLIAVRAVYYIAALQLFGGLLFGVLFVAWRPALPNLRALAWAMIGLILLAMVVRLPIEAAAMSGEPMAKAVAGGMIGLVLRATRFGHFWMVRCALYVLAAIFLFWRGPVGTTLATIAAGAALLLVAVTGHAGATPGPGGMVHLGADMIHLAAASAWLGGLLPFAALFARRQTPQRNAEAAQRFSLLGMVCVGLILASGIVNSWFTVGTVPALFGTSYGHVLLVKLALFLVLLAIAAINHFGLTPRLAGGGVSAARSLRRNAMIEAAIGAVILIVVGVLGTLPTAYEVFARKL
ncbi:MAG: copper homeostasis membrane protein CopD [Stellaceae bacterium]